MKLIGIATPGLTISSIFTYSLRESSPTGGHAPEGLSLLETAITRATERFAAPTDAVHPAVPALVCEATREKGIPASVHGEVAGNSEAMPKPVKTGASLSVAPLSVLETEKLVGEL